MVKVDKDFPTQSLILEVNVAPGDKPNKIYSLLGGNMSIFLVDVLSYFFCTHFVFDSKLQNNKRVHLIVLGSSQQGKPDHLPIWVNSIRL